jgi:phage tail-like protein
MAATGDRNDPLIAFCFDITLDHNTLGGFSECSGIQWELETQDYMEGGRNDYVLKFPVRIKQSNLTLKRGIVDRALWDWYWDVTKGQVRLRTVGLRMRDSSRAKIVAEWEFQQAFPCKWIGPQLNATQNSVAIETLELCYRGATRPT